MKRIGVAAIITSDRHHMGELLLGRRAKDPNRGMFVLPGGGVEENESLEEALVREIEEETGLGIQPNERRWEQPELIELADRIILVVRAVVERGPAVPRDGGDLYDVRWFDPLETSVHGVPDLSPVVHPILARHALVPWRT